MSIIRRGNPLRLKIFQNIRLIWEFLYFAHADKNRKVFFTKHNSFELEWPWALKLQSLLSDFYSIRCQFFAHHATSVHNLIIHRYCFWHVYCKCKHHQRRMNVNKHLEKSLQLLHQCTNFNARSKLHYSLGWKRITVSYINIACVELEVFQFALKWNWNINMSTLTGILMYL